MPFVTPHFAEVETSLNAPRGVETLTLRLASFNLEAVAASSSPVSTNQLTCVSYSECLGPSVKHCGKSVYSVPSWLQPSRNLAAKLWKVPSEIPWLEQPEVKHPAQHLRALQVFHMVYHHRLLCSSVVLWVGEVGLHVFVHSFIYSFNQPANIY